MTPISELRALHGKMNDATGFADWARARADFHRAADCDLPALLNRLEAAEGELERVKGAYSASRSGDQVSPPEGATRLPSALEAAVADFLCSWRAKYRGAMGSIKQNAPLRDEAKALVEALDESIRGVAQAAGVDGGTTPSAIKPLPTREEIALIVDPEIFQLMDPWEPDQGLSATGQERLQLALSKADQILSLGGGE